MIQQIINDAKSVEAEAITAEADSQKSYETFVKDTNGSIEQKSKDIVSNSEARAKAEIEKTKNVESLDSTVAELDGLSSESADLHSQCDFVLKNFETRQTGRSEEIEALKQVKQILSGAKFSQFLQSDQVFDNDSTATPAVIDNGSAPEQLADDGADPLQEFLDAPAL